MNIITTPHYNRPICSLQMISHLRNAVGIDDWHVVFICEPGCDEVVTICKEANLPSFEVIVNQKLLGLWENKKKCLGVAFNELNADFVLHLEDDVLISRDALLFYGWSKATYQHCSQVFTVNGFNKIPALDFYSRKCSCCNNPFYGQVSRRAAYNSIGFSMWRDRYDKLGRWDGSDKYLEEYRNTNGLVEVYPILSRINNIGFYQGISFDDEVPKTLLKQGISPDCLKGSTPDKLKWAKDRPELLTNELGNEWVKLNNDKCRSRKDCEFHRKSTYLSFWADSCQYNIGGFFE